MYPVSTPQRRELALAPASAAPLPSTAFEASAQKIVGASTDFFQTPLDPFDFPFEQTLDKILIALEKGGRDVGSIAYTLAKLTIRMEWEPVNIRRELRYRMGTLLGQEELGREELPIEIRFPLKQLLYREWVLHLPATSAAAERTPEIQNCLMRAMGELEGRFFTNGLGWYSSGDIQNFAAKHMAEFRTGRRQFIFVPKLHGSPGTSWDLQKRAMIYFSEALGRAAPSYIADAPQRSKDLVLRWVREYRDYEPYSSVNINAFYNDSEFDIIECKMPESLRRLWEHFGPKTFIEELFEPLAKAIEQMEKPRFAREFFTRLDSVVKKELPLLPFLDQMVSFLKGLPEELQSFVPELLFLLERMREEQSGDKPRLVERAFLGYQRLRIDLLNSPQARWWMQYRSLRSFCQIPETWKRTWFASPPIDYIREIGGGSSHTGTLIGRIRVIQDAYSAWTANPGEILVISETPNRFTPYIQASAVIVEHRGSLKHGPAILQQLAIPCITGATRALDDLRYWHGSVVQLHLDPPCHFEVMAAEKPFVPPAPRALTWPSALGLTKPLAGGKGGGHFILESLLKDLPKIPGIEPRLPDFTIIPSTAVLAYYDTGDPFSLREKILHAIQQGKQKDIHAIMLEHARWYPIPVPSEKIIGNAHLRSSGAFQGHPTLSYPGMFASKHYKTATGDIPPEVWSTVLHYSFREDAYLFQQKCGIDPFEMALIVQQDCSQMTHSGIARSTPSGALKLQVKKHSNGGFKSTIDEYLIDPENNLILEADPENSFPDLDPVLIRKIALLMRSVEQRADDPVEIEFCLEPQGEEKMIVHFLQLKGIEL
jgi:phosphohistidine swiveling domain-containing protein